MSNKQALTIDRNDIQAVRDDIISGLEENYKTTGRRYLDFILAEEYGLVDGIRPYIDRLQQTGYTKRRRRGNQIITRRYEYKPGSLNKELTAIGKIIDAYKQATGTDLTLSADYRRQTIQKEIRRKLAKTDPAVGEDKILSETEILQIIKRTEITYPWLSMIVRFVAFTGCRISEALGIKFSDIEPVNGLSFVTVRGKGNKYRTIPVDTELIEKISVCFRGKDYLFEKADGGTYDRKTVGIYFSREAQRALRRNVHIHMLRHSWATRNYKRDKNIRAIQKQLGHADVSTTLNMYTHDRYSPEEIHDQGKLFV